MHIKLIYSAMKGYESSLAKPHKLLPRVKSEVFVGSRQSEPGGEAAGIP